MLLILLLIITYYLHILLVSSNAYGNFYKLHYLNNCHYVFTSGEDGASNVKFQTEYVLLKPSLCCKTLSLFSSKEWRRRRQIVSLQFLLSLTFIIMTYLTPQASPIPFYLWGLQCVNLNSIQLFFHSTSSILSSIPWAVSC